MGVVVALAAVARRAAVYVVDGHVHQHACRAALRHAVCLRLSGTAASVVCAELQRVAQAASDAGDIRDERGRRAAVGYLLADGVGTEDRVERVAVLAAVPAEEVGHRHLFVGNRLHDLLMVLAAEVVVAHHEVVDVEILLQVMVGQVVCVVGHAADAAAVGVACQVRAGSTGHELRQVDVVGVFVLGERTVRDLTDGDAEVAAAEFALHGLGVRLYDAPHRGPQDGAHHAGDVTVAGEVVSVDEQRFVAAEVVAGLPHGIVQVGTKFTEHHREEYACQCTEGTLRIALTAVVVGQRREQFLPV